MATLKADMIFSTGLVLHQEHLDMVLLLGANHFFGVNKHTLGYTL